MIRQVCLVILLVCFWILCHAQDLHRIDSLKKIAPTHTGLELFRVLNDIAWEYRLISPDSTIQYANRAFVLGRKLGFKKKLARPLNYIGVAHEYKGEAIEAYDSYKQALLVATSQDDDLEIAYSNNNTGRLFFDQGNINRSLENYLTALKLFEFSGDSVGMAYVYMNLGHLYQFQKEYQKAEEYFKRVYTIRLHFLGSPNISSLIQLGKFYRESGQMAKSTRYFEKADSVSLVKNDEVLRAQISILLAENIFDAGNLKVASELTDRGFIFARKYNLTNDLSYAYLLKGKIYFKMNDFSRAKDSFTKVVSIPKLKDISVKMDAHYYLGQIYSLQGHKELELKNKNIYLMLRDSIKESDLAKQLQRLRFQYKLEIEQKKKENELLKAIESSHNTIIKKQETINIVYAVAMLVVVVIAVLLYRTVKMKHRHNLELATQQEEIVTQSEKLRASNLEIEKINANLEGLINIRTKKIKDQNELLTDYAYFNAHQVRGPLARILGLISVLHLEHNKSSFGPYMEMLEQAGLELDAAIKNINDQLDNIDEI
jgi:tetratricopeptide (TPR) repeat protein